ncbi:MAG: hypothetical protein JNM17_24940 [Archangium sp.]|nr:hypothetical protein [Archangium sp.]
MDESVGLFRDAPFRWWVSGGHALELFAEDSWRDHDDLDVGVLRRDLSALRTSLSGWELHVAAKGELAPWNGEPLDVAKSQNGLWCRRESKSKAWELEVLISEGDATHLQYRRDQSIRLPWNEGVLTTKKGVPYIAPHLQLLYKSTTPRPRDHEDASAVIPKLSAAQRKWLASHLPATHVWHRLLG